jgi:hypothetical protein
VTIAADSSRHTPVPPGDTSAPFTTHCRQRGAAPIAASPASPHCSALHVPPAAFRRSHRHRASRAAQPRVATGLVQCARRTGSYDRAETETETETETEEIQPPLADRSCDEARRLLRSTNVVNKAPSLRRHRRLAAAFASALAACRRDERGEQPVCSASAERVLAAPRGWLYSLGCTSSAGWRACAGMHLCANLAVTVSRAVSRRSSVSLGRGTDETRTAGARARSAAASRGSISLIPAPEQPVRRGSGPV